MTNTKTTKSDNTPTADLEESPFEAFGPDVSAKLEPDDAYHVVACDGEDTYLFLAVKSKGKKTYKVTEIYPGFHKRRTMLRKVVGEDPSVLEVAGRCKTIEEVKAQIKDLIFADFSGEDEPEVCNIDDSDEE